MRFSVQSWFAWTPEKRLAEDWFRWSESENLSSNQGPAVTEAVLPLSLRRRATGLGRKALAGALGCGDTVRNARYVFASRHGEFSRAIEVLRTIAIQELVSPAEFSMSVHHGLAGLLSIHSGNTNSHTAVAAGADSFIFGLLEAVATLDEEPSQPVLFIYADEKLPGEYAGLCGPEEGLPLVIVLTLVAEKPDDTISLKFMPCCDVRKNGAPALDFMRFFLSGATGAVSQGSHHTWNWSREIA